MSPHVNIHTIFYYSWIVNELPINYFAVLLLSVKLPGLLTVFVKSIFLTQGSGCTSYDRFSGHTWCVWMVKRYKISTGSVVMTVCYVTTYHHGLHDLDVPSCDAVNVFYVHLILHIARFLLKHTTTNCSQERVISLYYYIQYLEQNKMFFHKTLQCKFLLIHNTLLTILWCSSVVVDDHDVIEFHVGGSRDGHFHVTHVTYFDHSMDTILTYLLK